MDGVFARAGDGVAFVPSPPLADLDVAEVLATVVPRVGRLLARHGLGDGDDGVSAPDAWAEEAPILAGIAAASVRGTLAMGPRAGVRVRRCGEAAEADEPTSRGRCQARQDGFDLQARVRVPADERARLERLCRYALRPPVTRERLHRTAEGDILLALRHPWSDGTTHLLFGPLELLERLAVLIPRPRVNLILYHGVLAPRAAWRARVVTCGAWLDGVPPPGRRPAPGDQRDAGAARRRRARIGPGPALGRADAPQLWSRCARVSALWGAPSADRADRRGGRHRTYPASSRLADRNPGPSPGAGTTPPVRGPFPAPQRRRDRIRPVRLIGGSSGRPAHTRARGAQRRPSPEVRPFTAAPSVRPAPHANAPKNPLDNAAQEVIIRPVSGPSRAVPCSGHPAPDASDNGCHGVTSTRTVSGPSRAVPCSGHPAPDASDNGCHGVTSTRTPLMLPIG